MSLTSLPNSLIQIDKILVDFSAMRIKRAGTWHKVESKQVILLALLIEQQGQAISRDDLLDKIWPNVIVSDNSLSKLVTQLRKTIGDDRNEQGIIRTVPRVGYQLIATATQVEQKALSFKQQNVAIVGAICLMLGGLFSLLLSHLSKPYALGDDYTERRITQRGGVEQGASFSNDGRFMVFNYRAIGKSNTDLAVMDLQQHISHVIKNANYSEQRGVFSPDQKWLAYIRNDALQCNIRVISTASAIETWRLSLDSKLADCPSGLHKMALSWPQDNLLIAHFNHSVVRYSLNFEPFPRAVDSPNVIVENVDELSVTDNQLFTLNTATNTVEKRDFHGKLLTTLSHEERGIKKLAADNNTLWLVSNKLAFYKHNKRIGAMNIEGGDIDEISINRKNGDILLSKSQSNTGLFSISSNRVEQLGSSMNAVRAPVVSYTGNKYAFLTLNKRLNKADVWLSHVNSDSVQFITSLSNSNVPELMSFSPNGNFLLLGYLDSHLSLIDLTTKNSITMAQGQFDNVYWQKEGDGVFYAKNDGNSSNNWYFDLSTGLAQPNAQTLALDFMLANKEYRTLMTTGFRNYANHVAKYLAERVFDPLLIDNILPSSQLFTPSVYRDGIYFMVKKGETLLLFDYQFESQEYREVADLSQFSNAPDHTLTITSSHDGEIVLVNLVDNLQSDLVLISKTTDN